MNIESLSCLSTALMFAHHNVTSALWLMVGGSQNHEDIERVVREAIRDVSARSEVVRAELLGCMLRHDTTVEVFGYELPAVAYYEHDHDCTILVAVVCNGVDVTTLIDSYVILGMCEEIEDALQLAADEAACDEA